MFRHIFVFVLSMFLFAESSGQSAILSAGKLDDALDSCEKNYEEASQKKDASGVFEALVGMFDVWRRKGELDKGFFYAQKLYRIAEHAENQQWVFIADWCLAELYSQESDFADALSYYSRADAIPHTMPTRIDPDASFLLEWAETFSQLDQFDSAWNRYDLYRRSGDTTRPIYLLSTGEYFYGKGKFQKALANFQSALAIYREHHDIGGLMRTYPDIAKTFLVLGDAASALRSGHTGLGIALTSKANPYIRDVYSVLFEAYANLGMVDSANFYHAKYSDVRETVLNDIVKAKFATYRFEQQIAAIDRESQVQSLRLKKESFEKKLLLCGCITLAALAIAIFIIAKLARNNLRRKARLAETELELKALRARMDPHFIFNSLNSINRFIIRNETRSAADYLTKFAKLMRQVLESSANSFIPLSEELNILNNYLTLENLRFEQPFTWDLNYAGIDASVILIPALLIQPFVENAIWHGLYPRPAGGGKIAIHLHLDGRILCCEIVDNGIGRKKAGDLKNSATQHQVFREPSPKSPLGITLTIQRLEHIAESMPGVATSKAPWVIIEDLHDDTGEETGTRVLLRIPLKTT